jgi:hypothetical protein
MVAGKALRMLVEAIEDYHKWTRSTDEQGRIRHAKSYAQALNDFLVFSIKKDLAWKDMFTLETLERFSDYTRFKRPSRALVTLSNFLFVQEKIDQPLQIPTRPKKMPIWQNLRWPTVRSNYIVPICVDY